LWVMLAHLSQHRSKIIKAIHLLTWTLNAIGVLTLLQIPVFRFPFFSTPAAFLIAGFMAWSLYLNPIAGVLYCTFAWVQFSISAKLATLLESGDCTPPFFCALLITFAGFVIEISSHLVLQGELPGGLPISDYFGKWKQWLPFFAFYFVLMFGIYFILLEIVLWFDAGDGDTKKAYEGARKKLAGLGGNAETKKAQEGMKKKVSGKKP